MGNLSYYQGKNLLVTGHTGFKGSWLCTWLKMLGANVSGLALAPPKNRPSLFNSANIAQSINSIIGDIRDFNLVNTVFKQTKPEIVFHLAAQALVRPSYQDPITTYATNVLGTAHVLEAARKCPSVKTVLIITSDKCYQNNEWHWGYREIDRLGGKDPYSASKACAELVVQSYQESLLPLDNRIKVASARGGNVIGGGDWAEERLMPDIIQALQANKPIILRNPQATRPWQHVLELNRGYLMLAQKLDTDRDEFVGAWNFGPNKENEITVEQVTRKTAAAWGTNNAQIQTAKQPLHEANYLRLDSAKARSRLNWHPALGMNKTIDLTVQWYKEFTHNPANAATLIQDQIIQYTEQI
jgi:CDP-glucose 4,6-dehydratase